MLPRGMSKGLIFHGYRVFILLLWLQKYLLLHRPIHGERLHQVLHRQMRWVLTVQDGFDDGG